MQIYDDDDEYQVDRNMALIFNVADLILVLVTVLLRQLFSTIMTEIALKKNS